MEMELSTSNLSTYLYDYEPMDDSFMSMHTSSIIIYSVLLYIGLCTNIWMLWSLYKTWETGSRSHFYLLAICVADILGLCIRCSISIGVAATISWKAGNIGCKILMALQMSGFVLSHFVLAGFNVDNAVTIIGNRSPKVLRVVFLICALVLTVLICLPQGIVFREVEWVAVSTFTACVLQHDNLMSVASTVLYIVGIFWLPLFFILFCGGPALCVWCGKKNSISYQKMKQEEESDSGMRTVGKDIGMVTAYNILFILCWVPSAIMNIDMMVGSFYFPLMVFLLIDNISMANSCLNPIIYAVFNCIYKRRGNTSPGL